MIRRLVSLAVMTTALLEASAARAVPGQPDASFAGGTGVAAVPERVRALAIAADGKIVVGGFAPVTSYTSALFVARYNADGTPDTSFGGTGFVETKINADRDEVNGVAIQPDGRIVVVGRTELGPYTFNPRNLLLARYEEDGDLDPTFGGGDGIVTTAISAFSDHGDEVRVLADGKLLVSGGYGTSSSDSFGSFPVLLRYEEDGDLDTTFGGTGMIMDWLGTPGILLMLADGSSVSTLSSGGSFQLVRYDADGDHDPSFGAPADLWPSTLSGIALQSDGRIVASMWGRRGTSRPTWAAGIARFGTDGVLEASFGTGGILTAPAGSPYLPDDERHGADYAAFVAVDAADRVVILGRSRSDHAGDYAGDAVADILLMRSQPDGAFEPSFGARHGVPLAARGKSVTDFFGESEGLRGLGLQPDGRIVVAFDTTTYPGHSYLARFEAECAGLVCPVGEPTTDSDGDCECDAVDPCTSTGATDFLRKPLVVFSKINTDPTSGNDVLNPLQASFDLAPGASFADLRPDLRGARVVIETRDRTRKLDAVLPAGAFTGGKTAGWLLAPNGKTWTFRDRTATPVAGIVQVQLASLAKPATPRRVKLKVTGQKGSYPIVPSDLPVQVSVTLGDQSDAVAGRCTESMFSNDVCTFNAAGNTMTCRE